MVSGEIERRLDARDTVGRADLLGERQQPLLKLAGGLHPALAKGLVDADAELRRKVRLAEHGARGPRSQRVQ